MVHPNTRVFLEYKGETRPLKEWCELLGLEYGTVYKRLYYHRWTVIKAFEYPAIQYSKSSTECRRGHPYTEGSFYRDKSGFRRCNLCRKILKFENDERKERLKNVEGERVAANTQEQSDDRAT